MPDWLSHPHTSYVLAAYGVAGFGLLGLLVGSWLGWRRGKIRLKEVKAISRALHH